VGRAGDLELRQGLLCQHALLARFARVHTRYELMRNSFRGLKATAKRLGLKIPAPMVAQFRKDYLTASGDGRAVLSCLQS
jgi:hypothetical protein